MVKLRLNSQEFRQFYKSKSANASIEDQIARARALDPVGYEFDALLLQGFFFRPSDTLDFGSASPAESSCDGDEGIRSLVADSPSSLSSNYNPSPAVGSLNSPAAVGPGSPCSIETCPSSTQPLIYLEEKQHEHVLELRTIRDSVTVSTALHSHPIPRAFMLLEINWMEDPDQLHVKLSDTTACPLREETDRFDIMVKTRDGKHAYVADLRNGTEESMNDDNVSFFRDARMSELVEFGVAEVVPGTVGFDGTGFVSKVLI